MPDFKLTDASGASYKVTAPDENAALSAFQDMVAQQHGGPVDPNAPPVGTPPKASVDQRWTANAPPGEIIHGAGTDYISDNPQLTAPQVPQGAQPREQMVQDAALKRRYAAGGVGKFVQSQLPALNGMSFGWLDNAATTLGADIGALKGKSFKDEQAITRAGFDQALADQRRQYPIGSAVAEIGGAIPSSLAAAPEALAMKAAPAGASFLARLGVTGGNMARGAALGAGQGAVAGAGNADPGNMLAGGESGLLTGGALGGAIPAAGRVLAEGGRVLGAAVGPAFRTAAGLYDPVAEAGKRVAGTVARDRAAGQGGLTDAEFQAARDAGQNPTVMDLGGQGTRDLARSAVNTGPAEASAALTGTVADRAKQQAGRVMDFIGGLYKGGTNAVETEDALRAAARTANKPNYDEFARQTEGGVWTPKLAELTQAPAVAQAIQGASKKAANDAVSQGFKKVGNPFRVNSDGTVSLAANAAGDTATPTGRFWDAVKRGLDDQEGVALRAGSKDEAAQISELRKQLVGELDAASPAYANARGTAAKFFGASDALEAGRNFALSSMENPEAFKVIMKMSGPERDLFGRGFAHQITQKIGEAGENRNILIDKIFASPAGKQRLNMALGSERAAKLEAFLRVESVLDKARTAFGNSTTAKQLMTASAAGGLVGGYQSGGDFKSIGMGALIGAGLRGGAMKVDQRVAGKVAELLASNDPKSVQTAAAIIARSPAMFQNLRFATQPVATAARTMLTPPATSVFGQVPASAQDQSPQ